MADNLRKYTTQEVLNKVYTDSSGITIGLNSQTSKETLNAVLDSSNNRLQVAMAGGTISGDVTINGDLTVEGDGSGNYDEIINGNLVINAAVGDLRAAPALAFGDGDTGLYEEADDYLAFSIAGSKKMEFDGSGNYVQFGHNSGFPSIDSGVVASATNPGYALRRSDMTDGIGGVQGTVALITNSIARLLVDDNSSISLSNNDSGGTGGTDSTSGNTIFGYHAGLNLDSGSISNILIGHASGKGLSGSTNDYTQNVLIGGNSGRDITQGDDNVVVGHNAGRYLSQGDSNTLIGHNAGNAVINANNNTIVGANAGDAISSGANNSILGTAALSTATTALNNVFIGRSAGEDIPASQALNGAVAIGWEAFKGSGSTTTGADGTIAIGKEALKAHTTGANNTAIGYQALMENTTGASNTAIGYFAMGDTNAIACSHNIFIGVNAGAGGWTGSTSDYNVGVGNFTLDGAMNGASYNTAVGYQALSAVTTSTNNTGIGYRAGRVITTGVNNTAIGYSALYDLVDGSSNVAVGYRSGYESTSATSNTFVGSDAGRETTSGSYNVCVGDNSGANMQTSSSNVFIGFQSAMNYTASNGENVAIGKEAMEAIDGGYGNVVIGNEAMKSSGSSNSPLNSVAVGYQALRLITTGDYNVGVGYRAGYGLTTGTRNVFMGNESGDSVDDGADNTVIGYNALASAAGNETANTAIGAYAMGSINHDDSDANTAIGYEALKGSSISINSNVAVGYQAMSGGSNSDGSIAIGREAMKDALESTTHGTIGIGRSALAALTSGAGNIAVGYQAGDAITTGSQNTLLGHEAGGALDDDSNNTFIGYNSGLQNTGEKNVAVGNHTIKNGSGAGSSNTALGSSALYGLTSGGNNIAIGQESLHDLTTGTYNIAIGNFALDAADGGESNNIAIGTNAMGSVENDASDHNVVIGDSALLGGTGIVTKNVAIGNNAMGTGVANQNQTGTVAIGYDALKVLNSSTAQGTVAIGYKAGMSHTSGAGCVYVGNAAGDHCTDGNRNVAIGEASLSGNADDDNVAVGYGALGVCLGADNVGVGTNAGNTISTGGENTLIGYNTDVSATGSTNQIVIGNNVSGTADNAVHIGNDTSHIRCDFNSDQTWDASSDRRQKKDIKESELGLDFINDLKPCKYKYKSPSEFPQEWDAHNPDDKKPMGGSDKYYYGFIAQEVKESIDKHNVPDYGAWNVQDDGRQRVSREQFVVSLVKAVQELSAKVEELEEKLSK